ncbi:MAG TPA: M28 family peptidase [Chitinophagaceae bacterium]|jgi:hypothetical protein|nr:M28 family peptidase [Chitinophagaceae bacterium]
MLIVKKTALLIVCCFLFVINVFTQSVEDTITTSIVSKHLSFLSSDSLKGRGNYTSELQTAADYIVSEFKKLGLQYLPSLSTYFQVFSSNENPSKQTSDTSESSFYKTLLVNVIGVLPGKTKPHEAIILSAHYDHIGIRSFSKNDSIYNGANDNASGMAALLTLANYYSMRNDNDRTLIFCAFAGEELGLIGSRELAQKINPNAIKAMINIEMIGTYNVTGKNAFYITGAENSNLEDIFKKNLRKSIIKIRREPDVKKLLFRRSDNYPFALKGIPAHTIMCSDDEDNCYHQVCDEISRIDILNMTNIIKSITVALQSIISGADTPRRINASKLY